VLNVQVEMVLETNVL